MAALFTVLLRPVHTCMPRPGAQPVTQHSLGVCLLSTYCVPDKPAGSGLPLVEKPQRSLPQGPRVKQGKVTLDSTYSSEKSRVGNRHLGHCRDSRSGYLGKASEEWSSEDLRKARGDTPVSGWQPCTGPVAETLPVEWRSSERSV